MNEQNTHYTFGFTKEQLERVRELLGLKPSNDQPPDDPRARSLWSRDHRSTGPAKDQYEHRGQR